MENEEYVAIGEVAAPQGLKGEVRVNPLTDHPERFKGLRQVYLGRKGGAPGAEPVPIESTRNRPPFVLVKLAGVDDADGAAKLRGVLLFVPRSEVYPLPAGSYYIFQLIGLDVVDSDGGLIGVLEDVITGPANDVYAVRPATPQGASALHLIPATKEVVREIDLQNRRMVIVPLPGLLE